MGKFTLDSDDLFINCVEGLFILVLSNKNLHDPLLNKLDDWEHERIINPDKGDALEVFGSTIEGAKLRQLADQLRRGNLKVNREGYMYVLISDYGHFRLNDYFDWPKYGVNPTRRTEWKRHELGSKTVVVDLVAEYKSKLEEKEKELSSCKKQLEEAQTKLSARQKHPEVEQDVKVELKEERDRLVVTTTLSKTRPFDQQEDDNQNQRELLSCKEKIDKLEKELREVKGKLLDEGIRSNAVTAALKCLVTNLQDFNSSTAKDFDFELMLQTFQVAKHVSTLKRLGRGDTVSKISATILQIVEEENYDHETRMICNM